MERFEPEERDINFGVMEYTAEFSQWLRRRFRQRALARDGLPEAESLFQVRKSRNLSQDEVAIRLATNQSEISRFERRRDLRVSSLTAYVGALGGTLDLVARFPSRHVRIRLRP